MKKRPTVFRPDYLPPRKIVYCGIGLVAAIVGGILYASNGNIAVLWNIRAEPEDAILVGGIFLALFLSVLICVVNVSIVSWKNKNISYCVSERGISVVYCNTEQRLIHWSDIEEICVEHGPCEPDSEFEDGPYGVYVVTEHVDKSLYSIRDRVLNLTFSPNDLNTIQNACAIRIYQSCNLKKCYQVWEELRNMQKGKR